VGYLARQVGDPTFTFARIHLTATDGPYKTFSNGNSTVGGMLLYDILAIGKVTSRSSKINPPIVHMTIAETVRLIFELYLELG
jgi:hypothetical protein